MIRHYTQPIEPLLNDEQLNFLKQNIQLKVYQAEWAVLQQQSDLYQHNLTLIRSWIQTYYTQNPALANSLLEELDNLLITPHCAWAAREARQRLMNEVIENIKAFIKGRKRNVVA